MYTEEELLEAVNILIENYGLTEDEAINIISEEILSKEFKDKSKKIAHNVKEYIGDKKDKTPVYIGTALDYLADNNLNKQELRRDLIDKIEDSRERKHYGKNNVSKTGKDDYKIATSVAKVANKANKKLKMAKKIKNATSKNLDKQKAKYEIKKAAREKRNKKSKK